MDSTRILDMTAGAREIWFEPGRAVFIDKRMIVRPDVVASWPELPFKSGIFDLIIFDPPHLMNTTGRFAERYGPMTVAQLTQDLLAGAREARRVARDGAMMALKWATHDVGLHRVLSHLPGWRPLFGHKVGTRTRHKSDVFWCMLERE